MPLIRIIALIIVFSLSTAMGYITPLAHEWGNFPETRTLSPLTPQGKAALFLLTTRLTTGFTIHLATTDVFGRGQDTLALSISTGATEATPHHITIKKYSETAEEGEELGCVTIAPGFALFSEKQWFISLHGDRYGAITGTVTYGTLDPIGRFFPEESIFISCNMLESLGAFTDYALTAPPGNITAWTYPKTEGHSDLVGFFTQTTHAISTLFPTLPLDTQQTLTPSTIKVISRYYFLTPEEQIDLAAHTTPPSGIQMPSTQLLFTQETLSSLQRSLYEKSIPELAALSREYIEELSMYHALSSQEKELISPLIDSIEGQAARALPAKQFDAFLLAADHFALLIAEMSFEEAQSYTREQVEALLEVDHLSSTYRKGATPTIDTLMQALRDRPQLITKENHYDNFSYTWLSDPPSPSQDFSWSYTAHHYEVPFSFFYNDTTGVALPAHLIELAAPVQLLFLQQWDYTPTTQTWHNTQTGDSWSNYPSEGKWIHTRSAEGVPHATIEWRHNTETGTWYNVTTGEEWLQHGVLLWERSDFSEKWLLCPTTHSRYWIPITDAAAEHPGDLRTDGRMGYAPYSPHTWGVYSSPETQQITKPDHTWHWIPSHETARGAWVEDNNGAVRIFLYEPESKQWKHMDTQGFPPPLLPPLVVSIHEDIVHTQTSSAHHTLLLE